MRYPVADDLLEASDDEDYDKAEDLADELQDLDDEYDDIYYEDEFEDLLEDARDAWDDLRSRDRRELERRRLPVIHRGPHPGGLPVGDQHEASVISPGR